MLVITDKSLLTVQVFGKEPFRAITSIEMSPISHIRFGGMSNEAMRDSMARLCSSSAGVFNRREFCTESSAASMAESFSGGKLVNCRLLCGTHSHTPPSTPGRRTQRSLLQEFVLTIVISGWN